MHLSRLKSLLRHYTKTGVYFVGPFSEWASAEEASIGYHAETISDKALSAALAVAEGSAAFERDGVLFKKNVMPYDLIKACSMAASASGGHLSVVDFGGGFGSHFFQSKDYLNFLMSKKWSIVEQKHIAKQGQLRFSERELEFYDDLFDCIMNEQPNLAIFSSVLQYLNRPDEYLQVIMKAKVPFIFVDRTPFIASDTSRVYVQVVPKKLNPASYPAWLFSESELFRDLYTKYELVSSFNSLDGTMGGLCQRITFKGYIFKIRNVSYEA